MAIPKKIHYCWFGRNPKPKLAETCFASWRKCCPDYEIIEWNEDNYDLSQAPAYVRQAYEAKKWAFVTDYIRLQVVYEQGGIYLDTDVELLKPLDPLLENRAYFGFENKDHVNTGLGFGAEKGTPILKEIMEDYRMVSFVRPDGSYDDMPCPMRNTKFFLQHGLQPNGQRQMLEDGILILPVEVLCPLDPVMKVDRRTAETVSVHWYSASWFTRADRKIQRKERFRNHLHDLSRLPNHVGRAVFGEKRYFKIRDGIKHAFHKICGKK